MTFGIDDGDFHLQLIRGNFNLRPSTRNLMAPKTMSPLFKKLNYKAQPLIHILNAPASFDQEPTPDTAKVATKVGAKEMMTFGIGFAVTNKDLDRVSSALVKNAEGDAIIWIAYPKKTSKNYKAEFHRDSEYKILSDAGWEPCRMVAIDDDWSALRFRRSEYVKSH